MVQTRSSLLKPSNQVLQTSTQKGRRKAGNKKPPRSPPRPSEASKENPHQSSTPTPPPTTAESTSKTKGTRTPLPDEVQKQLATDIEQAGGITALIGRREHLLSAICTRRPELYGERGDPRRDAITKKVFNWKVFHKEGQYVQKVLNKYQVQSAENQRQRQAKKKLEARKQLLSAQQESETSKLSQHLVNTPTEDSTKSDPEEQEEEYPTDTSSSPSLLSSSANSDDLSPLVNNQHRHPTPNKGQPPQDISRELFPSTSSSTALPKASSQERKTSSDSRKRPDPTSHQAHPEIEQRATSTTSTEDSSMGKSGKGPCGTTPAAMIPPDAYHITVNIEKPEANREVFVFPLKDIVGVDGKTIFYGYYIAMRMDIRFYVDEPATEFYSGRVFSDRALLLTVPSWPYTFIHNRDELEDEVDSLITDAIDDSRHSYVTDQAERKWKYLYLEFPPGHDLISKEINENAGPDEMLSFDMIHVPISHPKVPGLTSEHWAAWTVARRDLKAHKRGKVDTDAPLSVGAQLLRAKLGGMGGRRSHRGPRPDDQASSSSFNMDFV